MTKTLKAPVLKMHGLLDNGYTLCGLVPDGKLRVLPVHIWCISTSFRLCSNCHKNYLARLRENPGKPLELPVKPNNRYQREVASGY